MHLKTYTANNLFHSHQKTPKLSVCLMTSNPIHLNTQCYENTKRQPILRQPFAYG